ncbi:MAG: peptidylprolyl isomerase [Minisyncoccia bacterium]
MKKYIIGILIIAAVGVSFWLETRNNDESLNNSEIKQTDLSINPATQQPENKLVETVTEVKDVINNNKKIESKIMNAILHTNKGDITIQFNSETPNTVANFTKLAKEGFYDGTKFHRIIKGFMNQGGDPLSKDDSQKAYWGTGGPGYSFADEITSTNRNDINTIAMANSGPNTNGSQFFINAAANNFLDTKHTVFGKVTAGMDVVLAINSVKTDGSDKPIDPVILQSITLK